MEDIQPKPRGVKAGALAACEEKVAFLLIPTLAGVKDGDSTLSAFLDLGSTSLAMAMLKGRNRSVSC
jgi:hypothetical protein